MSWQNNSFPAAGLHRDDMPKQKKYYLVISTCPGSITAKKIAHELVADQLAACVQVIAGVQSFFRWVGKVETQEEFLLLIKTTEERFEQVKDRITAMHPYELPEIVAVPIIDGLAGYLSWIDDCTRIS
jgi:periplasmic divalent cation tolerance protein